MSNKAKRKLSDISFEHDGAHVALVSKDQGGPANGHAYALVMKSTAKFSEEFIEKAQLVRVTMELPDFLEKFFYLYDNDAEVLAALFGYKESEDSDSGTYNDDYFWEWYREKMGDAYYESTPTEEDKQEFIASRLEGIELLKSLNLSESITESIGELNEDEYLTILRDQEKVEKALSRKSIMLKALSNKPSFESTNISSKETVMENEDIEVIKSLAESLQKSLDEKNQALEKALATVAEFEAQRKEAVAKARKESLVAAVKDESKAEVLFKSLGNVESQEDFDSIVKVLSELTVQVENSELFNEKGVSGEGEGVVTESPVAKALKRELNKA